MKNKLLLIAAVSIMLVYVGCGEKKNQSQVDVETETIDFLSFKTIESDSSIPDVLIKDKKYIKLDASDDNFLFKLIDRIAIHNERIYILDTWLKKLIVFDTTGTGIGCVGRRGQGPEEYLQITDFSVNENGDIYFIDGTMDKDRLFCFDRNFKFVSVKKMPFEANIVQCLPNDKLLFGLAAWNPGEHASRRIAVTNLDLETEQVYGEYDEYIDNMYWISLYQFINTGDRILYNQPINNYVYEFSPSGELLKAYLFDFGKKNVPDEYKKDIEGNLDKFEQYCCIKHFAVVNDKYLLGTLWDKTKTKTFIADRHSRQIFIKEIANSDMSNISSYCGDQIISYIYPGKYDDIQATDLPVDVKKYVEDENFVLCLSTLK